MLVPYTVMLFFPGGNPAAGASIRVTIDGSNVPPLLYMDAAGTLPSADPIVADGMGAIGFYAAPGLYLAELAGTFTRVPVDPAHPDPVWPDLHVHTQAVPAAVWTVDHFFGVEPQVNVVIAGMVTEAEISHPDAVSTVITFGTPAAGVVHLRR